MNRDQLTPAQREAVRTLDRSLVVTAGPGAGKTRVLVERVQYILERGDASLDEIVAVTFTNRAAREMKTKLRQALRALAERDPAPRWRELARQVETAAISTIHGFCARLLRAHPVEAQVDPEFTILDEFTSRVLLARAVAEVVQERIDAQQEILGRLVIGYSRRELCEALTQLYATLRALGQSLTDVLALTEKNRRTLNDYHAALARWEKAAERLIAFPEPTPQMAEQIQAFEHAFRLYGPLLRMDPRIEDAPIFEECLQELRKARVSKRGRVSPYVAQVETCLEELEWTFYDVCAGEVLAALGELMHQVEARYEQFKRERNGLDYEDLQWKARQLLRAFPPIAASYRRQIRHLLVDEFQDTNALQKEILDLLRGGEERVHLFLVGDAKQSIYNFRGAAVEVFLSAQREIVERGGAQIELQTNFRSTEPLVRFFNEFFSRLLRLDESSEAWEDYPLQELGRTPFAPMTAHRRGGVETPVELLLEIGPHVREREQARRWEAERLADRLLRLVRDQEPVMDAEGNLRPARYGDIALLFRAMTDVKIYERALRERGIPYYVLAGRGFYEREEIQDLLSLLQFLENKTDEVALVAALRSPLFGLSDEALFWLRQAAEARAEGWLDPHPLLTELREHERVPGISPEERPRVARAADVLQHLLRLRNRLSLVELLEEILALTHFEAIQATAFDGHQRVANIRKLIELARGFEAGGPHVLSDFLTFVRQFAEIAEESEAPLTTEAADAVRLLTVHKAKGLEFPIVVLPDLSRPFRRDAPPLLFDRAAGLGLKIPDLRGRLHETWTRQRVLRFLRLREHFENQRLLFVAMTRAQDRLILSGASERLRSGDSSSEDLPVSGTSWLDWIVRVLELPEAELPDVYTWNGLRVRLRVGRGEALEGAAVARQTLIARYPALERGEPPPLLPPLSEAEQQQVQRLLSRLAPVVPEPVEGLLSVAVTRLLALNRCPLQFYYESVLDLPTWDEYEDTAPTGERAAEPARLSPPLRGRLVHRFCQEYDGSEPWEQVLTRLIQEMVPERVWAEAPEGFSLREAAWVEVRPLVQNYVRSDLARLSEAILWGGKPGRVESEREILYRARWGIVRGRLDKVIRTDDGAVWIVDFKTDRLREREDIERLAREYALQMQIYALAAQQAWHPSAIRAELYFLVPDVRVPVSVEALSEVAALVDRLTEQIARGRRREDFPARPDPERCRRCRCRAFCPLRAL